MQHVDGTYGTFAYPDVSVGQDGPLEYVRRMREMPISERMLANADFLYEEHRAAVITDQHEYEMAERLAAGGDLRIAVDKYKRDSRGHFHEDWIARDITRPASAEARERITAAVGPTMIPRSQVADVARAAQMHRLTGLLPDREERDAVYACPTQIGRDIRRLDEVAAMYWANLWIEEALVDTDLRVTRTLNRAIDALTNRI